MPVKTYTVHRVTIFTADELHSLLKEAHEYCKSAVKPKPHRIGKRGRLVITRPRAEYQACIRNYIEKKIQERIGSVVA